MDYTQFTPNPLKNKHLTLTERVKIELMLKDGKTAYAISKALERPINTVLNEIRRGTVDQIKVGNTIGIYLADAGQAKYIENRKACCKQFQILECEDFVKYIETTMLENPGRWMPLWAEPANQRHSAKLSVPRPSTTTSTLVSSELRTSISRSNSAVRSREVLFERTRKS